MRTVPLIAGLCLLSLVSACNNNSVDGYIDATGKYVPLNAPKRAPQTLVASSATTPYAAPAAQGTNYDLTRAGYYDANGNFWPTNGEFNIPYEMFPPRGMCRIWYLDRKAGDQPNHEACTNIRTRLPANAYIVYGG